MKGIFSALLARCRPSVAFVGRIETVTDYNREEHITLLLFHRVFDPLPYGRGVRRGRSPGRGTARHRVEDPLVSERIQEHGTCFHARHADHLAHVAQYRPGGARPLPEQPRAGTGRPRGPALAGRLAAWPRGLCWLLDVFFESGRDRRCQGWGWAGHRGGVEDLLCVLDRLVLFHVTPGQQQPREQSLTKIRLKVRRIKSNWKSTYTLSEM